MEPWGDRFVDNLWSFEVADEGDWPELGTEAALLAEIGAAAVAAGDRQDRL